MKEIIERYINEKMKDRERVSLKDFYCVYSAIEEWHDRTPIPWDIYRYALRDFFILLFAIIVRIGYIYKMGYDLGALLLTAVNKDRGYYKIEWRKEWKKYNNYNIYTLRSFNTDSYFAHGAVLSWMKEIRKSNDLGLMEEIGDEEQDDYI